ncbi:MAG: DEAD/DEAH box helicase [Nocardioidaceae bacterium]
MSVGWGRLRSVSQSSALEQFTEPVRGWFEGAFSAPTPAQEGAWAAIAAGRNTLVVAPTGSGKTLSAFLWSLDKLVREPADPATTAKATQVRRCRVLYISPLKALGVDVERNLRAPLVGIRHTSARLGLPEPDITVGVRSGDTPAADRRKLATKPPDILITTPESLFLMLTSSAREALRGVETVILDEVHAVAGTKRGAHLAVSLERLDALLPRPAQRIGLSATVRPIEEVARFLGGSQPVEIVAPPSPKEWDLRVVVPVEDMTELGQQPGEESDQPGQRRASIWPHVEEQVVDLVGAHRSTIVFANSRRLAERLTARLNEIAAERSGEVSIRASSLGATRPPDGNRPAVAQADRVPPVRNQQAAYPDPSSLGPTRPPEDADRPPAQIMAQSGASAGAAPLLARAHHASVAKEQRAQIEADLKSGRLSCVVATSSLELGIDMGAVDLVVQIESPPSVASALQRVGRAGHQVGEVSHGVLLPKHRADLVHTAVAVERMRMGAIEALRVTANPLDVLAQQIVAATAVEPCGVDELYALIRRAAPFTTLPRSAYEATLDLLTGRYPSDEFAELRPRVVWDRIGGTLTGRPGSQRLAVTSGGTIPDRGLFGVFLVGEKASRVGELDEEMVYESRVGDVFALGATSWRIEDITHDRVLVSPAPGQPGRLPFWKGDQQGRPAELGQAIGEFTRELGELTDDAARERCRAAGLDDWAAGNLVSFLAEQRAATRVLPTDRTLLVERFRDELGDWRIVLHSPYGSQVHAPWALAIAARLAQTYGIDAQAIASEDGIVLRVPETDLAPPGAEVASFDATEIDDLVTGEVVGSALFASRFRECAARALLLPRRDPGRRSPLWQQRQRSAQLLSVAAKYPTFPIVLEAVRECLQDVYDVPALRELLARIERREVRIVEVETSSPSPFARSLLFGYVAAFMYEGDNPVAERRAAALSLDQGLLAELLGRAELRELLDPAVLAEVEAELQRLAVDRRARDPEALTDLLRLLGPLSPAEISQRCAADPADWLTLLTDARRVVEVRIAGERRFAVVEDVSRLRDALGVPIPPGTPEAYADAVDDPLGDLVARYARTHGPFTDAQVAQRFGLGISVVRLTLDRLAAQGRVLSGEFRPTGSGEEWCDADVLRRLRRRSLAALRQEVEPVEPTTLGRFLPAWQHVASESRAGRLRGVDGVLSVIDQLAGCPVPASAWESLVLPARVVDYQPGYLDELCAAGEVVWAGHGSIPGGDGWVSLHPVDLAPLTLPATGELERTPLHDALLDALAGGGGYFFGQLGPLVGAPGEPADNAALEQALWDLVWAGYVTGDTPAALRGLVGDRGSHRGRRAPPQARSGRRAVQGRALRRATNRTMPGRWALLPDRDLDATRRAHATAEALLERHGVVTRGAVVSERTPGGFAAAYKVLSAFEDSGRARRGYFVGSLGAAQFGTAGAVDRLRTFSRELHPPDPATKPAALTLAATDPANPYGAALPWPARSPDEAGHRPGRKAGALVVLVDGALTIYVERGGRTLLTFTDDRDLLGAAAGSLAEAVSRGALGTLTVETVDGTGLLGQPDAPVREALEAAGFVVTPRGLRLRS